MKEFYDLIIGQDYRDIGYAETSVYGPCGLIYRNAAANKKEQEVAAFIVKACNTHDELVACLRELHEIYEGPGETDRPQWQRARAILAKVQA